MKLDEYITYKLNQLSTGRRLSNNILNTSLFCLLECVAKLMLFRHHINTFGGDALQNVLHNRSSDQSVITVSNHHSCLDDMFLWGSLLSVEDLMDRKKCRWTLAGADICFTNKMYTDFFIFFRGLPVWRKSINPRTGDILVHGRGVYQQSIDFSIELLNTGEWLHIFPQGRVIQLYERHLEDSYRLRWGVGRLIAEAKKAPILIPIWHCGFEQLNLSDHVDNWDTMKRIFLGRPRCLTVMVGSKIDFSKQWQELQSNYEYFLSSSNYRSDMYSTFTNIVQKNLYELKRKAEFEHNQFIKRYE